jgi:hypothetical protein
MAKKEIRVSRDGSNNGPCVDFEERCTVNLGDYQSLTLAVRYSRVSNEDDLAACQALLPRVITAVDSQMGELVLEALGEGVREDLKAAVLGALAQMSSKAKKQ